LQVVTQFLIMETLLDDSVGREIDLEIERGGNSLTVKLEVFCSYGFMCNLFNRDQ
jgi:pro-apoptotic serine protease NMA111